MGRKKKTAEKVENKAEKKRFSRKKATAVAEEIEKRPAVSVDAMIDENKAATISTDYQKYLRKLMKRAGGKQ